MATSCAARVSITSSSSNGMPEAIAVRMATS
jgi:hypothetical protein